MYIGIPSTEVPFVVANNRILNHMTFWPMNQELPKRNIVKTEMQTL